MGILRNKPFDMELSILLRNLLQISNSNKPLPKITFIILFLVDCVWGPWQEGTCSEDCGPGKRNDTRNKTTVEAHGGSCYGEDTQEVDCNLEECAGI